MNTYTILSFFFRFAYSTFRFMFDIGNYNFPLTIILIGCIVKLSLFYVFKSKRDKLTYLLFYPNRDIVLSSSNLRRSGLKAQNHLSSFIFLILITYCVILYIIQQMN